MPTWDPKQYLQFERQRTQPCIDLVTRIDTEPVNYAVDLGCGPGNSTAVLDKRFPSAKILGVDNSVSMIERAKKDYPACSFTQADATTWTSERPCDVILANAVFQWTGHHETLFPRLVQQLRPGGVLAIQMPRNFQSPTHQILRELARSDRWKSKMSEREPYWVQPPGFYYDVLSPVCSKLEIWETEYQHMMPDHDAIVEWYKGTGLRPYLEALNSQEQTEFIDEYRARLKAAYPRQKDGMIVFPFLRTFFVAVRR
jgi:trans-aconitate 2-methyltransferase